MGPVIYSHSEKVEYIMIRSLCSTPQTHHVVSWRGREWLSCSIFKRTEQKGSAFKCLIDKYRTALAQKSGWKNELVRRLQYCFTKEGKMEAKRVTCPRPHVL